MLSPSAKPLILWNLYEGHEVGETFENETVLIIPRSGFFCILV